MLSRALPRTQAEFVSTNLFELPIRTVPHGEVRPGFRAQVIPICESLTQAPGCMRGLRSALLIEAAGAVLLYGLWHLWHLVR